MKKEGTQVKPKRIPYYYKPEGMNYEQWQIGLRRQFGSEQEFKVVNLDGHPVFADFSVTNPKTDKTYKVAIRSEDIGLNYCSCPDFRINTLGTCKHIEFVLHKLKKNPRNLKLFKQGYQRPYSSLYLKYGKDRQVILRVGKTNQQAVKKLAMEYFDKNYILLPRAFEQIEQFINSAQKLDSGFRGYHDAINYIIEVREARRRMGLIDQVYVRGVKSPMLKKLLKTKLYDYQKEAILKAVKAGRCLMADDMGLGKTVQAIGVAEIMAQELGISSVLIICPTSLKYQWKNEIAKFSDRSALVIEGPPDKRKQQYQSDEFFKILSYNVVLFDLETIQQSTPDLVILDEAQRIKNWKTKTAQYVKQIASPYALVLTGTPLENRLEELHSLVEFIDRFRLGPLFRFLADHQITDDHGKVVGYTNLNQIAQTIEPILIRRTRDQVLDQLPERMDKNYFVDTTEQQMAIHQEYAETVSRLVSKWRRLKFLPEKDRQMLMIALNCMRMVSNSTYILDQETRHDTKIDELKLFLADVWNGKSDKVVVFSQWERMTRLIAKELENWKVGYQYLHGGIPSPKRKGLLKGFHEDPNCLVFLSTDAGGVGLNLQCASVVVNMDCPWNPAVLEQRIGRIHRLGQHQPVRVINFISKGTIEEQLLKLIGFKKSLFGGVLDKGEDQVFMGEDRFKKFMRSVETVADDLGKEEAVEEPVREPLRRPVAEEKPVVKEPVKRRVEVRRPQQQAEAIQDLFVTGISFLEKLQQAVEAGSQRQGDGRAVKQGKAGGQMWSSFVEKDEQTGKASLKIPLPEPEVLEKATQSLQGLMEVISKR